MNPGNSVLCTVCERPRLATRPSVTPTRHPPSPHTPPAQLEATENEVGMIPLSVLLHTQDMSLEFTRSFLFPCSNHCSSLQFV